MALRYLTASPESNQTKGSAIWESTEIVSGAVNGDTILLADNSGKVTAWVIGLVTTGEGKIQYTTSIRSVVIAETSIVWRDWDAGSVVANTDAVLFNVSAVRVVGVSGNNTIEARVY